MTTTANAASNGGNPASIAQPAIDIPDFVTIIEPAPRKSARELAVHAAALLTENSDLPAPVYFSVTQAGQEISLQFAGSADTFRAMADWAERFGSTVTAEPGSDKDSGPYVRCAVEFSDLGVRVKAYAYIKPARAA